MSNEIIEKINQPLAKTNPRNITLGGKAKYFEHVENLQLEQKITISTTVNGNLITTSFNPNNEFFNLFVLDSEDFTKTYFYIERKDCLLHIDKSIVNDYSKDNFDSLSKCLEYPCLFTNKNKEDFKTSAEGQRAYFGYLTKIEETNDGYKFYFSITCYIDQNIFNQNCKIFNLKECRGENELDSVHWSIKQINLVQNMRSLGYPVAAY